MKRPGLALLVLGVAFLPACQTFSRVTTVNHIVVASPSGDTLGVIRDSARIAAIVGFINDRTTGWGAKDWAGVRGHYVRVELRDTTQPPGRSFKGSFGAGPRWFETQRDGDFASRDASSRELDQFVAMIQVPRAWITTGVPDSLIRDR